VGVHCPGFEISRDERAVRDAVERLGIAYPVLIDADLELWREYENEGWPARYLFDGAGRLFEYHFGEGAYADTEVAIQELVGVEREPLAPLRPEDAPGARLAAQTADRQGPYSGPYEAGGVWGILAGEGTVRVGGTGPPAQELQVTYPGAYRLAEHPRHMPGLVDLEVGPGVRCEAVCFTPGVA
jgi:hypothetical protein